MTPADILLSLAVSETARPAERGCALRELVALIAEGGALPRA